MRVEGINEAVQNVGVGPDAVVMAVQTGTTVGMRSPAELPGNYAGGTNGNPSWGIRQARASTAQGALDQTAAKGEGGGVSPPPGADLAIEIGDVPLNSVGAQPEAPGDL